MPTAPTTMAESATLNEGQCAPVPLDEIDHVAVDEPVDHVAERAADHRLQRPPSPRRRAATRPSGR
jgi:hypothetical protein